MTDDDVLAAAVLTGYARALAAQQLGVSVPRLMQLANRLLDEPAMAADLRVVRLRAARDTARLRRRAAGRL